MSLHLAVAPAGAPADDMVWVSLALACLGAVERTAGVTAGEALAIGAGGAAADFAIGDGAALATAAGGAAAAVAGAAPHLMNLPFPSVQRAALAALAALGAAAVVVLVIFAAGAAGVDAAAHLMNLPLGSLQGAAVAAPADNAMNNMAAVRVLIIVISR